MTPLMSSMQQLTLRLYAFVTYGPLTAKPSDTHLCLLGLEVFGATVKWET